MIEPWPECQPEESRPPEGRPEDSRVNMPAKPSKKTLPTNQKNPFGRQEPPKTIPAGLTPCRVNLAGKPSQKTLQSDMQAKKTL